MACSSPPSMLADFRDAMARLGAGVNVVTTRADTPGDAAMPAQDLGFIASAVCSVSAEPPTVLVCMNRGSRLNPLFRQSGRMCVNGLTAAQRGLVPIFAGQTGVPMAERFAAAQWERMATGSPVLRDAAFTLDCEIADMYDVATHTVLFGKVCAVAVNGRTEGLVWFNRQFHALPLAPELPA